MTGWPGHENKNQKVRANQSQIEAIKLSFMEKKKLHQLHPLLADGYLPIRSRKYSLKIRSHEHSRLCSITAYVRHTHKHKLLCFITYAVQKNNKEDILFHLFYN